MQIFLTSSRRDDFRQWSKEHRAGSNDDDVPGGATPIAIAAPLADYDPLEERPHRPWLIPGVGGSF
jgi:hypothetical protein